MLECGEHQFVAVCEVDVRRGCRDPDLTGDCIVNFADLGALEAVFFTSDPDADFDGSGSVNFVDLGVMKSFFFLAPGPSGVPNACSL